MLLRALLVVIINLILAKIVETLQQIIGCNNNKLIYNLILDVFARNNTVMMEVITFVINAIILAKLVHKKKSALNVIFLLLDNYNKQKVIRFNACSKQDILKILIKFVNNALKIASLTKKKYQCTDCRSDKNRVLNDKTKKCDFKDRMYEDKSGVCQNCHFSCEGGGSATDCKTCNTSNNRIAQQQKDQKVNCLCMQTFQESNKTQCDKCRYSCLTCSKNSNENSCDSSLFRVINSGKCICKPGYVEVNQKCVPCHKSCQECT
ncbi:hypothetical protein ABPG72_006917 [Tetrahymena utriculariae]